MIQMPIKHPVTGEEMLTIQEIADELHISRPAITARLKKLEEEREREIDRYELGNKVYIPRSDVTAIATPRPARRRRPKK